MLAIILYVLLLVLCLAAVALNILSLPGNWLMFIGALCVSAFRGWDGPSLLLIAIIFMILLVGEAVEFLGSLVGAKKFGASNLAAWSAIAGAFVGGILGFTIPVPLVGNLVGAIMGAFLAAWFVELLKQKPIKEATWAAVGAALGRVTGIAAKITCGIAAWFALLIFPFLG